MIGIDTNVLVRLLTRDDAAQAKRAAALFERNPIFISKTVLLESEWVLRFSYQLDRPIILEAFRKVAGLPRVTLEDGPAVAEALRSYEQGMDFADSLHLASSRDAEAFATFDEPLKKRGARAASDRKVVLL